MDGHTPLWVKQVSIIIGRIELTRNSKLTEIPSDFPAIGQLVGAGKHEEDLWFLRHCE